MERTMTIQTFSARKGLPSCTLRYYEKEKLIAPHVRGENGYRLYTEDQIPLAVTIHSLRQADVNLSDIRHYLTCSDFEKSEWVRKWREEMDAKITSLQIARRYLSGMGSDDKHIRLVKWETDVRMLWRSLRVARRLNPYAETIRQHADALQSELNIRFHEAFIQTEKVENEEIIGRIGFRLPKTCSIPETWIQQNRDELETFRPSLFVSLDCLANDAFACFNLMMLLQSFGYEPAGPKLERYDLCDMSTYQWMIPVLLADTSKPVRS